jgi:hypothetical protein
MLRESLAATLCIQWITSGPSPTQHTCSICDRKTLKRDNPPVIFSFYFSVPLLDSYQKEQGGGISPVSGTAVFQKPQEPNIDFELDVKVFINSGKCVLHTKDPAKEDELKL